MNDFIFLIEDIFTISGMGTVVTGYVENGQILVNDIVQIEKFDGTFITVKINGIEKFRKKTDTAIKGENCGLLLYNRQNHRLCRWM